MSRNLERQLVVIKNRLCLLGTFLVPLLLAGYFGWYTYEIDRSLVPISGTIHSFERKGTHSTRRRIFSLEEYRTSFVRYDEGLHDLFIRNLLYDIHEPPPHTAIEPIYYLQPQLKPRQQRQVSLFIRKQDWNALQNRNRTIPFFYLLLIPNHSSRSGYYLDLYLFVFRSNYGVLAMFVSLMSFLGCCLGATWWYERYKALQVYAISIIILHVAIFMF
ncbi:hypothetical protein HH214_20470 [Mucilaginibacter robiniae]|uniref:Uncharacterized protein n=1 Tax=Mucilaginibacter robiniae TaxID=2728022 RepID=A0A7L5E4W1_9SPHI|nr:hypothetical protein [Mucilaginibacter robiniae]QJD98081.1 hypothetical protein HH214_20470 [Mucilaginibacter robiniae]